MLLAGWLGASSGHGEEIHADLVVYGGTSAGVVAAVQARKMGKSVILIESGRHLGGMSVEGLGGSDIDNHGFRNSPAVGGLALEFYRRISASYNRGDAFEAMLRENKKVPALWRFEPHVAEKVFDRWVEESGVTVHRGVGLRAKDPVVKNGSVLVTIVTDNDLKITGRMFIDATYEGDLLAAAGISAMTGREGNAKYSETLNGVRTDTKHNQFEVKVDPYIEAGNPQSGLIFGVQSGDLGEHGDPDNSIQAYCFRLCLTQDPANRVPFDQPAGYNPDHYELQRRFIKAGGKLHVPRAAIPNGKTDPGAWHHLCGNMPGWNHGWPDATPTERRKMLSASLDYIKGLCWFLANDPDVPDAIRSAWSQWGTCKDEFQDNGGWPRMFYVRNGRRMIGDFVLTERHGSGAHPLPVEDPVALVWWAHDLHNARRIVRDGAVWNEGAVFGGNDWIPFGVPYRSLVPKASECTNLLTPTCPSSSYVAYGAFRLEWTFMATAQAAATAASLAIDDRVPVQQVSYDRLRQRLVEDAQIIKAP